MKRHYKNPPIPPGPGGPGYNPGFPGYGQDNYLRRLEYQVEENSRRIRNLNRRVRRIENYLGIRNENNTSFDDFNE